MWSPCIACNIYKLHRRSTIILKIFISQLLSRYVWTAHSSNGYRASCILNVGSRKAFATVLAMETARSEPVAKSMEECVQRTDKVEVVDFVEVIEV